MTGADKTYRDMRYSEVRVVGMKTKRLADKNVQGRNEETVRNQKRQREKDVQGVP